VGWAEVAGVAAVAPPLVGWLSAVGRRQRTASDLYAQAFQNYMILMPMLIGACAWLGAWRLHLAHGAAGQPVAIIVGVLFGAQTFIWLPMFAFGAGMGAEPQEHKPPEHPYRVACAAFCQWAYAAYLLSIPLALVVTIIGLLNH